MMGSKYEMINCENCLDDESLIKKIDILNIKVDENNNSRVKDCEEIKSKLNHEIDSRFTEDYILETRITEESENRIKSHKEIKEEIEKLSKRLDNFKPTKEYKSNVSNIKTLSKEQEAADKAAKKAADKAAKEAADKAAKEAADKAAKEAADKAAKEAADKAAKEAADKAAKEAADKAAKEAADKAAKEAADKAAKEAADKAAKEAADKAAKEAADKAAKEAADKAAKEAADKAAKEAADKAAKEAADKAAKEAADKAAKEAADKAAKEAEDKAAKKAADKAAEAEKAEKERLEKDSKLISIKINDIEFKKYLLENFYSKDEGDSIKINCDEIKSLDFSNKKKIENLDGIENFKNLSFLNVSNTKINSLNLGANKLLNEVQCLKTNLYEIDLTDLPNLSKLNASNNFYLTYIYVNDIENIPEGWIIPSYTKYKEKELDTQSNNFYFDEISKPVNIKAERPFTFYAKIDNYNINNGDVVGIFEGNFLIGKYLYEEKKDNGAITVNIYPIDLNSTELKVVLKSENIDNQIFNTNINFIDKDSNYLDIPIFSIEKKLNKKSLIKSEFKINRKLYTIPSELTFNYLN